MSMSATSSSLPRKNADLRALGGIRRSESHAAAAEEDDRRRAFGCFGEERAAGRHVDREIGRAHDQVVNVVLCGGVQRETIQAGDDRQAAYGRDTPGVAGGGPGRTSTRQVPSRPSMPRSANISTTSRRVPASSGARSRSLTTTRVAGGAVSVVAKSSKLGRLICGIAKRKNRCAISRCRGLLEAAQERGDAIGRRLRGGARGQPHQREHQADSRRGSELGRGHRQSILEPPAPRAEGKRKRSGQGWRFNKCWDGQQQRVIAGSPGYLRRS